MKFEKPLVLRRTPLLTAVFSHSSSPRVGVPLGRTGLSVQLAPLKNQINGAHQFFHPYTG
jgi:hypothetical protein